MGPIYEGTKISIEEPCQWLCLETCHAFHAIVYASLISYTSIYGSTCIMTGKLYTHNTLVVTNKMTDVYIELSYLL